MILNAVSKYTTPVFKKDQPDDSYKFQPLPKPTGSYPYHLKLQDVQAVKSETKMVFHMVGDTGSVLNTGRQQLVVNEMTKQFEQASSNEDVPQFLYHLGDLVYHHGQAERYVKQFFEPYRHYPGPIFAIAGNHDSDVNPDAGEPYQSLAAFKAVFCDDRSRPVVFSNDAERKSMTQPHIYWTLDTPLANIIGLHSNVPKFGVITDEQRRWFVEELIAADLQRPGKALIVCLHHSPHSADINHGSSKPMIQFLEGVFDETGIRPDIVFSAHVHNYQRFAKHYPNAVVPYIVAGAGGFDELHSVATIGNEQFTPDSPLFNHVELLKYADDQHGFLKITIQKVDHALVLTGEYFTVPHPSETGVEMEASLFDRFEIKI